MIVCAARFVKGLFGRVIEAGRDFRRSSVGRE